MRVWLVWAGRLVPGPIVGVFSTEAAALDFVAGYKYAATIDVEEWTLDQPRPVDEWEVG